LMKGTMVIQQFTVKQSLLQYTVSVKAVFS